MRTYFSLDTLKAGMTSIYVGALLAIATVARAEPIGFLTNQFDGEVVIVDLANGTVLNRITTLDPGPFEIALSPDESTLYVGGSSTDTVDIISTQSPFFQQSISLSLGFSNVPIELDLLPNGSKLYTADWTRGTVSVVDTVSRTKVASIPTAFLAYDVTASPDGGRVFATSLFSSDLFVIDSALDMVIDRIPLGSNFVGHVAMTPDGRKAYISSFLNQVIVVDVSSRAVVRSIAFNAAGADPNNGVLDIAIDPQGAFAYVLGYDTVNVINLATDTLTATIPVGVQLSELVVDSSGTFVYVTTLHQTLDTLPLNEIVKISTNSLAIVNRFRVGGLPAALAVGRSAREVAIDIKPGSYPNSVNLGSGGVVPVAILSSATFDATQVDPSTITLASAQVKMHSQGSYMASFADVNGDGRRDLVVHVDTRALQLTTIDTEAVLKGKTFSNVSITGQDTIRIVP